MENPPRHRWNAEPQELRVPWMLGRDPGSRDPGQPFSSPSSLTEHSLGTGWNGPFPSFSRAQSCPRMWQMAAGAAGMEQSPREGSWARPLCPAGHGGTFGHLGSAPVTLRVTSTWGRRGCALPSPVQPL